MDPDGERPAVRRRGLQEPHGPGLPDQPRDDGQTRLTTASLATALPGRASPTAGGCGASTPTRKASSWSNLSDFTVTGPAPVLTSPPNGTAVNSNALLFTWSAQARATRYKIDASTSSTFTSLIETATTDMTAWAPGLISPAWPNGTIYWRVSSLDTNNVVSGTSQTWSFTRDASTAGEYTAVNPDRVLDTRKVGGMIGAGQTRTIGLTGGGSGIPTSGVSTVVLNVTVTGPTKGSYVNLWAAGQPRPTVSTINFAAGQTDRQPRHGPGRRPGPGQLLQLHRLDPRHHRRRRLLLRAAHCPRASRYTGRPRAGPTRGHPRRRRRRPHAAARR